MKTAILLLVAYTVYIASAMPMENAMKESESFRYVELPDADGKMKMVDLDEELDQAVIDEITRNPANTGYFLFTRQNPRNSQTLVVDDANSIRNSNYNANRPTVVISHGWLSNQNTDINPTIRDAYLARMDINVIVIDWRRLALSNYYTAVRGVPAVGRGVGQFINFLIRTAGGNLDNFHLVGFNLGAHLVGNAGRELGGRVARVTGLDPAGPLWNYNRDKLNSNDGIYVEAIHTDGGVAGLGLGSNVGDADFYPNGGQSQPGCLTGICNHNRAWELFAATVSHNHLVGHKCTSNLQITLDNCRGSTLLMGNGDVRKTGRGMFRVNTARRYPF